MVPFTRSVDLRGDLRPQRRAAGSTNQADATGPHEQAHHDEHDAPKHLAAHDGNDARDDKDDGKDPQ